MCQSHASIHEQWSKTYWFFRVNFSTDYQNGKYHPSRIGRKPGFLGTFLLQVMDVNALCDADNPTVAALASVRVVNRLFQLGVKMNHLHSLSLTNRLSREDKKGPLIATNCLFFIDVVCSGKNNIFHPTFMMINFHSLFSYLLVWEKIWLVK